MKQRVTNLYFSCVDTGGSLPSCICWKSRPILFMITYQLLVDLNEKVKLEIDLFQEENMKFCFMACRCVDLFRGPS